MTDTLRDAWVPWPAALSQRYRALGVWAGQTLQQMLVETSARTPTRIALVDARRRVTYRDLTVRVAALATGLQELGIRAGQAVILQLPNCIELVEVFFALSSLGARPVMALPAHREREIGQIAAQTRAVAHVVCDTRGGYDYRALSHAVRARCETLVHTVVVGEPGPHTPFEGLFHAPTAVPKPAGADEIALFQLSGGTTNVPKLIPRTHDDYLYSVRQSVRVCRLDAETVYLVVLPAAHNFPLSSPGWLGTLMVGGTVVLSEQAAPDHAFALIAREGVTHTALVPALLQAWLGHTSSSSMLLKSLRVLQVGGAKLHEAQARRVASELGCKLQQVFGMAEGLVCYTGLDDALAHVVACQGRPMSELDEIRVVDAHDCDVPSGTVGHLLARGPYTIRGYFGAPEHNASAFTPDGYYRTGDLVRLLPDGSLVVEGRSKDQINRAGEKIAAPEIEELLCTHPSVVSAALVAVPDAYLGEGSCAFVVLREPISERSLRTHLREAGLAPYKIPDRIAVVDGLPLTAVGKIDKKALAMAALRQDAKRGEHKST